MPVPASFEQPRVIDAYFTLALPNPPPVIEETWPLATLNAPPVTVDHRPFGRLP